MTAASESLELVLNHKYSFYRVSMVSFGQCGGRRREDPTAELGFGGGVASREHPPASG